MKNSKFPKILQTLTIEELKSFSKFIKSPYFNTNKTIIKLFEYLKKHNKDFLNINEAKIYNYLYPGKAIDKKRIRDLSSEMLTLCELFISHESFGRNEFDIDLHLLKGLNPRNLQSIFMNRYNLTLDKAKSGKFDYDYFLRIMTLHKELFRFYNTNNFESSSKVINPVINNVYKTISFELLRCSFSLEIVSKQFNIHYDQRFLNGIMNLLKKYSFFDEPIVEIYFQLNILIRNQNSSSYEKVLRLYDKNKMFLKIEIRKEIFVTLVNYLYIFKPNLGKIGYKDELYKTYTKMFTENLHLDNNGYVILNLLHNFTDLLITQNKIQEAESVIEACVNNLGFECLNYDTINYFYGRINMKKGNFELALDFFDKVSNKDLLLSLDKKKIQLICYYELGQIDIISQKIITFMKYITRNTDVNEDLAKESKYFAENLEMLLQSYEKKSFLIELNNKLNNHDRFTGRAWLIEKINERLKEL